MGWRAPNRAPVVFRGAFQVGCNYNNGDNANNGAFYLNGNNDPSNTNDNTAARLSNRAQSATMPFGGTPSLPFGRNRRREGGQ